VYRNTRSPKSHATEMKKKSSLTLKEQASTFLLGHIYAENVDLTLEHKILLSLYKTSFPTSKKHTSFP